MSNRAAFAMNCLHPRGLHCTDLHRAFSLFGGFHRIRIGFALEQLRHLFAKLF